MANIKKKSISFEDLKKVKISDKDVHEKKSCLIFFPMTQQQELLTLGKQKAEEVAIELAEAYRFLDSEPQKAKQFAMRAVELSKRVAITRETLGICAYHCGDWKLAITELGTARRINFTNEYAPLIADSFRGLGNPKKVIEIIESKEYTKNLSVESHCEMAIVLAGAYNDLGETDMALKVISSELRRPGLLLSMKNRLREAKALFLEDVGLVEEAEKCLEQIQASHKVNGNGTNTIDYIVYESDADEDDLDISNGDKE